MDYHYHAIVLGKKDVGEADRLYTLYTLEAGKIKVMAKGVRKTGAKLSGFLEPITEAEVFVARSKGTGKATGALVNQYFPRIKNDWERLEAVFYALKFFQKIVTGEVAEEKIFFLLKEFLETMEGNYLGSLSSIKLIAVAFLIKIFKANGYSLEAEKCAYCGKSLKAGEHYFSPAQSGALCVDCQRYDPKAINATANAVKIIRLINQNRLKNISKIKADLKDVENAKRIIEKNLLWVSE